jgi:predicted nucleotidyltransferase
MSVYVDRPPVDEVLLAEIVRCVLSVADAERIILFGSAATGTMTEDSDIDLLVLETDFENPVYEAAKIHDALQTVDYPFDVLVMRTERFEETKTVIGGLAFPANKYGRVLYEKPCNNCE